MAKNSAHRAKRKRVNLLKRVVRGNLKAGNMPPGFSRLYTEEGQSLSAEYAAHGKALSDEVFELIRPQWPTSHMRPRRKPDTPRWF